MNNGVKTDIEFIVFEDTLKERTVIISQEISWKSNEGFKQFYLRLNTQETDTMFLNVVTKTEDCCTFHVVEAFRINGQELYTDHAIFAYVYLK
jgi:hypothetical protein